MCWIPISPFPILCRFKYDLLFITVLLRAILPSSGQKSLFLMMMYRTFKNPLSERKGSNNLKFCLLQAVELIPLPEDTPDEIPVQCNGKSGILLLRPQKVLYAGQEISASKFEALCGRGDAKKWKTSLWIQDTDGSSVEVKFIHYVIKWMITMSYLASYADPHFINQYIFFVSIFWIFSSLFSLVTLSRINPFILLCYQTTKNCAYRISP